MVYLDYYSIVATGKAGLNHPMACKFSLNKIPSIFQSGCFNLFSDYSFLTA